MKPISSKSADYFPLYKGYSALFYLIDTTVLKLKDSLGITRDSLRFSEDTIFAKIDSVYYTAPDSVFVLNLLASRRDTIDIDSLYLIYSPFDETNRILSKGNDVFYKSMIIEDSSNYKQAQHAYQNFNQWSWDYNFIGTQATFRTEYAGLITVKAGIFDSCYSVISEFKTHVLLGNNSTIDTAIYAPNLGLIREIRHTNTVGTRILELLSIKPRSEKTIAH